MRSRTVYDVVEYVSRYSGIHGSVSLTRGRIMLIESSIQFAIATGHAITLRFFVQLIRAFIGAAGTLDGPSLYLLGQSTPEHVAQEVLYITNVRF